MPKASNSFFKQSFLFNFIFQSTMRTFFSNFSNFTSFYKSLFTIAFWSKIRVLYYLNNWVYTTNHKRIAVNYFWFVILSGIVGMVLATLIRLEFAYPGVGIFAGDSLQYLSLASAHGVIMVFFMIMPLLFGAFANFLLPTQLGVHDVAFPRLNSAAFWFLPGGLLMLCQLVCVDRRYQRMNCFNIREVQSLLKRKFFTDLLNTHDYRELLNKTSINLRFKTQNISTLDSNVFLFYNYGLKFTPQTRVIKFTNDEISYGDIKLFDNLSFFYLISKKLNNSVFFFYFNKLYITLYNMFFFFPNTFFSFKTYIINFYVFVNYLLSYNFSEAFIFLNKVLGLSDLFYYILNSFKRFFQTIYLYTTSLWSKTFALVTNYFRSLFQTHFGYDSYINDAFKRYNVFLDSIRDPETNSIWTKTAFNNFWNFFFSWNTIDSLNSLAMWLYRVEAANAWNMYGPYCQLSLELYNYAVQAWNFIITIEFKKILSNFISKVSSSISILVETSINEVKSLIISSVNLIFKSETRFLFRFIYHIPLYISNPDIFVSTYWSPFYKFVSNPFASVNDYLISKLVNEESSDSFRYQRFSNPIFKYDYKAGDYFPKLYKEVYPYLFTSINDLTSGLRTSPWFFSANFFDLFSENFNSYLNNASNFQNYSNVLTYNTTKPFLSHTDAFYNFFYLLSTDNDFINSKWVSLNSLNQKFYRMFATSSMQQRIYSNWRQLKFTREAWRCKLLASRHQRTLLKRYVHEDGIFWSIERNAKDLLPGWAMITPFSSRTRFTAIGKTDIGLMGVLLVLNSSIISAANFLVTYRYLSTLNNRKMRDARAFFTEGIMVASWMMVAANPMLVIAIIMLLSDRHWQTSFFDYSGGGDTVLFQHMFWFFGHPEVYIIIIPTFGFTNTMLSYYLKKRVSARASLLYSMYTIAFLGFFVWGHHMYMVGLAHTTRMLFSTLTVMISVPAATKIMHWCVTLVNSSFATELPLLFGLTFIFFFVSGGISGMCVAHTGMDVLFHDTFYVIGHFHVMLAGAGMFSSFGGFYFYFPAIFGVKYSRIYAYLHYTYYLIGQLMTVIPMFWLGYAGMPRRVLDYPASLGGWHSVASAGHMLSVAGLMAFFIMIFDSLRQARAVTRNTFGVSRYNIRLNFYLYEISRNIYLQQKTWFFYRYTHNLKIKSNHPNFSNYEHKETTLLSYVFITK